MTSTFLAPRAAHTHARPRPPASDPRLRRGRAALRRRLAAAGIKKFQHAYRLAWELELEAWPGWATALHRQLLAGAEPSGPPDPPCVNRGTGWLFPALCAERAAGPVGEWWRRASALDAVGAALARKHFAILDDFAPAAELHAACAAAWRDGALHPARVAAPGDGPTATSRRAASRSDHIAWVDPQEWAPLRDVVGRMDSSSGCCARRRPPSCRPTAPSSRGCGRW